MQYYLLAFDSTHAAIAADRLLNPYGAVIMPTLRTITASCGMSLRLKDASASAALAALRESTLPLELCHLYRIDGDMPTQLSLDAI